MMSTTVKVTFINFVIADLYIPLCFAGVPVVSIDQINHLVSYGDNFTINCTVDAEPQATQVFWIKSNLKLHELVELNAGLPGTMGMTVDEPSLTITYATESDAGLYACFAINEIGKGRSDTAVVTVKGGVPSVITDVRNYTVLYGQTVILACSIDAYPPIIDVHWKRNLSDIVTVISSGSVGLRGINQTHPSLILDIATSPDSGTYVCIATNNAGTGQSEEITLVVYGGIPTVTANQTSYSIRYGYSVILHCEISAEPHLTNVYWERLVENKKSIVYSGESGTSGVTLNNPSLIINFATLRDEGYYNCFGRNVAGTGNGPQIHLTVTGGKPIVAVDPFNETVEYGRRITLSCHVIASPKLTHVYWQKSTNGTITSISNGLPGVLGVTVDHPSLTIEYVTREDIGIYTCIAKNALGIGRSNETVNINLIAGIPTVTVDKLNYTAHDGNSVQLMCTIRSNPQHNNVFWEKKNNDTTATILSGMISIRGVTVENPSLTIDYVNMGTAGEYRCFATNEIGTSGSQAIDLVVLP
ncbi:protein sax-3-like isoform X2 [Mytilus galloprovincialis]|uniref:protein sax-3-like isoform X2 n=1 Tax=Mytilus galloprovincialis TaxID=29158 RepID=UPI003F7CCE0D